MPVANDRLAEAIQEARDGEYARARTLLARILVQDPDRELAWLWLSQVVESDDQRRLCLEHVLRINPESTVSRRGLAHLDVSEPPLGETVSVPPTGRTRTEEGVEDTAPSVPERDSESSVLWPIPGPVSKEPEAKVLPAVAAPEPREGSWTAVPGRSSTALARVPATPFPVPRRRFPWLAFGLIGLMVVVALAALTYVILRSTGIVAPVSHQPVTEVALCTDAIPGQYATGPDGRVTFDGCDDTTQTVQVANDAGDPISGADLVILSASDGQTALVVADGFRPYLGTWPLAAPDPPTLRLEVESGAYMEQGRVQLDHLLSLLSLLEGWEQGSAQPSEVCNRIGRGSHAHELIIFAGEEQDGPHLLLGLPGTESGQEQCTRVLAPLELVSDLAVISVPEMGIEILTLPGHQERGAQGAVFGQVLAGGQWDDTPRGVLDAVVRLAETEDRAVSLSNGWYYLESDRSGAVTLVAERGALTAGPATVDVQLARPVQAPPLEMVGPGLTTSLRERAVCGTDALLDQVAVSAKVTRYESVLFVMNEDGSQVRRVADMLNLTGDFAWSPDGEYLAVIAREEVGKDNYREVYRVPADGTDPVRVTQGQVVYSLARAPGGRWLAFASLQEGNRDIYTIAVDGSGLARLTTARSDERNPVWSRDGSWIAFLSDRDGADGGSSELYTVPASGGQGDPDGLRRLTFDSGFTDDPEWSPDAAQLVYQSAPAGDLEDEIFVASTDGRAPVRLTDMSGPCSAPTWSPDGLWIAFHAIDDRAPYRTTDVYVVAATGGEGQLPFRLTDDPADDFAPTWSPDGCRLAFVSGRDGSPSLYSIGADGTDLTRLATIDGVWQSHAWRPRLSIPEGVPSPGVTELGEEPSPMPTAEPVTPAPTAPPSEDEPLPDLVVRDVRIAYEGAEACLSPSARIGTMVELENAGQAAAGPFVFEVNGSLGLVAEGLDVGEVTAFWFAGAMLGTESTVRLDVDQQVKESDEENNALSLVLLLLPALPPCPPG